MKLEQIAQAQNDIITQPASSNKGEVHSDLYSGCLVNMYSTCTVYYRIRGVMEITDFSTMSLH